MKRAARILGLVGGILGVAFGYIAVFVAGRPVGIGVNGRGWLLFSSLAAMILAIVAGWVTVLVERHPRTAGAVVLAAGLLGFVCVAYYWLVPALFLLTAGGLALGSPAEPQAAEGE